MEPDFSVPLVAYRNAAEKALADMREWLRQNPGAAIPDSAWDLPNDSPIWKAGLSLAQAQWVLGSLRRERTEEVANGGSLLHPAVGGPAHDPHGLQGLGSQEQA